MALPLRVCLFSQAGASDSSFHEAFEQVNELHVIAECAAWQELQEHLHGNRVDAVVVNLDSGDGEASPYIVQRIAEVAPACGIIGVSQNTHPDTIIAAMRAGCGQFVRWPIDPEDLCAAVARIRQSCVPAADGCRRICVVGSSGGSGVTTVACNLAMELAHASDRRCALVDMNLEFGDVACSFDVTPRYSIADICRSGVEIDRTLLEGAFEELPSNVSILARPEEVGMAQEVCPDGVEQMFRIIEQMFAFVVADLPRYLSPATVAALEGADRVLIVSQLAVPQLRNAGRIYEHLLRLGAREDRIDVVLNRCNANFERIKPEEVEKHFGRPVFAVIPNDYKRIGASRDLGHPIMSDAPNSPARVAIQEMAQTIAREHLGEEGLRTAAGGLLGLFRKRPPRARQPAT